MKQFDADRIFVSLAGVIFADTEKEEMQKFDLPFIVFPTGEIKELQSTVYDLSDIGNLLDCETVRLIHKSNEEGTEIIGNILCIVSSGEAKGLELNNLAKLIAWRMNVQSFGDKVIGPAFFCKPAALAIDLGDY